MNVMEVIFNPKFKEKVEAISKNILKEEIPKSINDSSFNIENISIKDLRNNKEIHIKREQSQIKLMKFNKKFIY